MEILQQLQYDDRGYPPRVTIASLSARWRRHRGLIWSEDQRFGTGYAIGDGALQRGLERSFGDMGGEAAFAGTKVQTLSAPSEDNSPGHELDSARHSQNRQGIG